MLSRNSQRVFSNENLDPRLRAGLVGHWIGGGSGNTWFDRSGYGNHGTLTSGPVWTLGEGGKRNALQFDGVDDRVNITRFTVVTSRTFAAWVRTTGTDAVSSYAGNAALHILGDSTGGAWIGFGVHGGKVRYLQYASPWQNVDSVKSVNDGSWHHVVASHSSVTNSVNVYVDGVLDATGTITLDATYSALDRIGCGTYNLDFFDGALDDVRIYNRVLSEAEVALLATPSFSPVTPRSFVFGKRGSIATADPPVVTAALSVPSVTASYAVVVTASPPVVTVAFSVPSVTATVAVVATAGVAALTGSFSVPAVTATYVQISTAGVAAISSTFSIPSVTATYPLIVTADAPVVTISFSIPSVTAFEGEKAVYQSAQRLVHPSWPNRTVRPSYPSRVGVTL